jgi:hypothetical protein
MKMESEEIRGVILKKLHDRWITTGQFFETKTTAEEISQDTGIPKKDIIREAEYLGRRGLLKNIVANGQVFTATEDGIDFTRRPDTFPEFAGHIVINAGRDVAIVSSQFGSVGDFHAAGTLDVGEVLGLLNDLRRDVEGAVVEEDSDRREVMANIDALATQVGRPVPKAGILRPLYHDLATTIQATAALADLWPKLEQLGRLLGAFLGGTG